MVFPNQTNQMQGNTGKKKKNRKRNRNKPWTSAPYLVGSNQFNNVPDSNFQAPYQDELIDLTDDLAPKIAESQAPEPSGLPIDNKLSFKFQNNEKQQDWMQYQNKFKTIEGDSNIDGQKLTQNITDQKQKQLNQEMDSEAKQPGTSISTNPAELIEGLPANVMQVVKEKLKNLPVPKIPIVMPKVEEASVPKPVPAPPLSKPIIKPIELRFLQNRKPLQESKPPPSAPTSSMTAAAPAANFTPNEPHMYSFPAAQASFTSPYDYPKGIPKSFLQNTTAPNAPSPPLHKSQPRPLMEQQIKQDYQTPLDLPSWILPMLHNEPMANLQISTPTQPVFVQTNNQTEPIQAYSPTDVYADAKNMEDETREGSESPDVLQPGQKRLSAFKRLGPLTITQPKKPKLTINLMFNKEQAVREVVDETEVQTEKYLPAYLRHDVQNSQDDVVTKYVKFWPWKKNVSLRKTVTARSSKSVMMLEQEQMETAYEKDSAFIQVTVKGYPASWEKEDVLDAILECVKGKSFIPCFVEFTPQSCKFLVMRCRQALIAIHKVGFCVRKGDVELTVSISLTDLSLNQIDLIPRLVVRKRLVSKYDGEKKLDLSNFFVASDVSNFLYFPLNRVSNQAELTQMQSAVNWEYLKELNLSRNKISCLDGLDLQTNTPKLTHLDLSYNLLDKMSILMKYRQLHLLSLKLEGNPMCHDYIDPERYVKVAKMMFSGLRELDGVPIPYKGDLPTKKRNYCPDDAATVVERFLEVYFPLLESPVEERAAIENMYDTDAVMTITYRYKMRYGAAFRYFRNLFLHARVLEEGSVESIKGAGAIGTLLTKWPVVQHDRYTFTVDVLSHDESTTIVRVSGILKLTSDSLAEDEHMLTFTRTFVLHTENGAEYKIYNDMVYWDVPNEENDAFHIVTVRPKPISLKLETPPDEDLKEKLLEIFTQLACIDKKRGKRCMELKNWDLRIALEYYVKLLKLDDLTALNVPDELTTSVPQPS